MNVNAAGETAPNLAIVPLSNDGKATIYSHPGGHLVVDITGYITGDTAPVDDRGLFVPIDPDRVFELEVLPEIAPDLVEESS